MIFVKSHLVLAAFASRALAWTQEFSNTSQSVDPHELLNRSLEAILGTNNASQIQTLVLHGPRYVHPISSSKFSVAD